MGVTDFESFARRQLPRLTRYAVMLTGERDTAADLVQDVMVKVFRRWSRIASSDRPDHYVLRMLTNEHLSWRRRRSVRTSVPVADVGAFADRAAHGTGRDTATEHAVRDDLWQRLAGLPPRQRAVLVLRYYEQLSDAEIAMVLGCSPVTVRGYAHRALHALRLDLTAELRLTTQETR